MQIKRNHMPVMPSTKRIHGGVRTVQHNSRRLAQRGGPNVKIASSVSSCTAASCTALASARSIDVSKIGVEGAIDLDVGVVTKDGQQARGENAIVSATSPGSIMAGREVSGSAADGGGGGFTKMPSTTGANLGKPFDEVGT
jgi:hypothetical protein